MKDQVAKKLTVTALVIEYAKSFPSIRLIAVFILDVVGCFLTAV